jgi:hypothetical protein
MRTLGDLVELFFRELRNADSIDVYKHVTARLMHILLMSGVDIIELAERVDGAIRNDEMAEDA